jgi:hypothetical protein
MSPGTSWLRCGALLAAGAYAVHQLRYLVAYGDTTEHALRESGHAYLSSVEPLIGLAMAFLAAQLLMRWLAANSPDRQVTRRGLTTAFTLALLVVFTSQELLEGMLATGHDHGLAGVFAAGGWVALPLAAVVGAVLARFVNLVDAAAASDPVRLRVASPPIPRATEVTVPREVVAPRSHPLARHLAGRAPPHLLS